MKIKMVCLEDGIIATGYRKMAAFVETLNPETETYYVSTNDYRSLLNYLRGTYGSKGQVDADAVDEIAQDLVDADLIGFSSMTGYSDLTKAIVKRVRERSKHPYLIWGGIHPIIHPEDAIESGVDAICTGEGEFAFAEFHERLEAGRDPTEIGNFWFKRDGEVVRNGFLPLMTAEQMESMPFPKFAEREHIYRRGEGFVPVTAADHLASGGLCYTAIWSIGCPFHCAFCGNTKFISNDPRYKKIPHPSARYVVEEIKAARRKLPHLSTVQFQDDSFMAIPLKDLRQFAELWREELGIPFAVYGVIPNYVQREKIEILTWAGMNRVRMGVQSGSARILDFYKRPTPPDKTAAAAAVLASFAPRYHIPPTYDIVMDNPIETREDVVETLEFLYHLARPFTLLVYSLKVIPNTELERAMRERGVDLEDISSGYLTLPPRWANMLLYLIAVIRPPRWLWNRLLRCVESSAKPQKLYPTTTLVMRALYIVRRAIDHLRFMDFSIIPGFPGYFCWKIGLVRFWQRYMTPRHPKPTPPAASAPRKAETVVIADAS